MAVILRAADRAAAMLAGLGGWRAALAALLFGLLTTFAMPPWYVVPVLPVGFTGLIWLLDGAAASARPLRRGALAGFLFGTGYFIAGIPWLAEAFLVDAARHGWMIPFALGGLSALLGLFAGGAALLAVLCWRRFAIGGVGRVLFFAASWMAFEWLRCWLFTGFPWNLVGYVWTFSPVMSQSAALVGVLGLGLVTVAVAAIPAALAGWRPKRRDRVALLVATLALPLLAGYGGWRLAGVPAPDAIPVVDDVRLRLVQAGIPQRQKWRAEFRQDNLQRHLSLSRQPAALPPTHIVWPETAVPFYLVDDPAARAAVAEIVPPDGLLISGTVRVEGVVPAGRRFFNSVVALTAGGDIAAIYDKHHLVPFGEYVPLGHLLPLDKIVAGVGDFAAGPGPRTLVLSGLPPVGPLICYEAIFPGAVVAADKRPGWLLNLTNDGWFGSGAGPRQHLAIARMRAVEEGLPLVRVAGTGISAVVDPYGRIMARLDIGVVGVIDSGLPRPLDPTVYSEYADVILVFIFALTVVMSLWSSFGRRNDDI
ncbi:MAG: apolipoprotein N-acyltransferase [Alphaproteobacteria bacterium]